MRVTTRDAFTTPGMMRERETPLPMRARVTRTPSLPMPRTAVRPTAPRSAARLLRQRPSRPARRTSFTAAGGSDPRFQCRTRAECGSYELPDGGVPSGLVWRTGTDDVGAQDCTTPAPACPVTAPPTSGSGLDNPPRDPSQAGLDCVYEGVAVTCAPCPGPTLCLRGSDGGYPYQWFQTKLEPGCPGGPGVTLPNWGSACSSPGVQCNYNLCASTESGAAGWAEGVLLHCQSDGTWTGLGTASTGACL
jgi:hypothetical protein